MLTTPFPRPNPSNSPPKPPLPVQSLDINLNFGPPALGDMFNTPFEFGEAASSTNSAGASTKPRSFDFVFPSSQVQTRSHQDDANGSGSGYSYQRYTPPRFLGGRPHIHTAYYSARSEFEPELEPQNEAEVEPLNYTPYYTAQSSPEPETPTPRPPSPVPTMDFSMISPPNSPTFHSFADAQRTPPRVRPGITRLWESFASPGGPLRSKSRDNLKIPNVSGIGRSKSPPTMHIKSSSSTGKWTGSPVGKLKEKRRAKARKRSLAYGVSLDLDLDYGAMPPLDGEEGELIAIGGDYIWETDQSRSPSPTPSLSQTPTPIAEYSDPLIAVHSKQVHTLPPELFLHILSFLPLRSVLAASAVCLRWRVLAMDNAVWWELWKRKEVAVRWKPQSDNIDIPICVAADMSRLGGDADGRDADREREVERDIGDEGVHLDVRANLREHEDWDEPSGWTVDLGRVGTSSQLLWDGVDFGGNINGNDNASVRQVSINRATSTKHPTTSPLTPISQIQLARSPDIPVVPAVTAKQAPLMLDWRQLYRSRAALERRWRDPEGEPQVQRIEGHRDSVYCLDFDSSRIITGSRDRTIKVWCVKTGKCLATFEGHAGSVLCLKFERDWDIAIPNGEHSDHKIAPTEATRSSEARGFMVSGSSDCSVCVWDLISSRNDKDGAVEIRAEVRKVLRGHAAGVLDLRMDDRWVVSCSKDALINVYSRQTLALHTVLRGHEGPVNAVGLEGGHVVSASGDGKMMLWDVETGERVRVYEGHERGLACIEFKNDLILSGSNDCTIKLWRASTGECLHTFAGHTSLVRALCFDPKTGYIVSASYDRSVRVWEWRDGDGEGSQQTIAGTSSTSGWRGSVMNVAVPGKPKGLGRLVREFRNLHASHIFDVKFDVGRIVSTSHDQKIVVLDFKYDIEGAELFV